MSLWDSIAGFFGSIGDTVGDVVDWFVGTDSGMGEDYGTPGVLGNIYGYADSFLGSSASDAVGKLLGGSKDKQDAGPKVLPLGAAPGAATIAAGQARFVGQNNTAFRNAVRALSNRANVNPDTARLAGMYLTKRQGQQTIGLGSPAMARVTPASAASVRTESKQKTIGTE